LYLHTADWTLTLSDEALPARQSLGGGGAKSDYYADKTLNVVCRFIGLMLTYL